VTFSHNLSIMVKDTKPMVSTFLKGQFSGNSSTLKKKGAVRNLKRVPRIVTNSEPFLGFVTVCYCSVEKKGFVRDYFFQHRKGFRS
jgi:hypothetical protein